MKTSGRYLGMLAALLCLIAPPAQATVVSREAAVTTPLSATWDMRSSKGRHYRVLIARPHQPAPPEGYPVIYVLDGNSAFGTVVDAVRMQGRFPGQTGIAPSVVVAIGYPTEQPFDPDRRIFDMAVHAPTALFPPRPDGQPRTDMGGGADDFLAFILDELKPAVEAAHPVDRGNQTLLGHSIGGLFTLHALFTRPAAFQHYLALSPSVWWRQRYILAEQQRFIAGRTAGDPPVNLFVAAGEFEQDDTQPSEVRMVDNAREVVARLAPLSARGVRAQFHFIEGEHHRSTLPTVLSRALRSRASVAHGSGPAGRDVAGAGGSGAEAKSGATAQASGKPAVGKGIAAGALQAGEKRTVIRFDMAEREYIDGEISIDAYGVDAVLYGPDGQVFRRVLTNAASGVRNYSFISDAAGAYRLELGAGPRPARYRVGVTDRFPAGAVPARQADLPASPRLEALRRAMRQHGDGRAEDEFWERISAEGTPMVEAQPGGDDLVTFLWRGTGLTKSVELYWKLRMGGESGLRLERLEGSDVWFRSVVLPRGTRASYQFVVDLPPSDDIPVAALRGVFSAAAQVDPLNRNRWPEQAGLDRFNTFSVLATGDAGPAPWSVFDATVPRGEVERHRIDSTHLGEPRDVSVYVPNDRHACTPCALLVLFDEEPYLNLVDTPRILDNLIHAGGIRPTVAVLISNPSRAARGRDLPPNGDFADFVANELVPWMRTHHPIADGPEHVVVAGSSYGGLASAYMGFAHPQTFGKLLIQSGSFWWSPEYRGSSARTAYAGLRGQNWMAAKYLESPRLALEIYMDAGLFELGVAGDARSILEQSRHLRDVLLAKGYRVHYREHAGGHDYLAWQRTLADGLIALLPQPGS